MTTPEYDTGPAPNGSRVLLDANGKYAAQILSLVAGDPMSGKWMQISVHDTRDQAQAAITAFVAKMDRAMRT